MCSLWPNWQYGSIDSDNGLEPTRRQAIIRTIDALGYWRIYASLGLKEFIDTPKHQQKWYFEPK